MTDDLDNRALAQRVSALEETVRSLEARLRELSAAPPSSAAPRRPVVPSPTTPAAQVLAAATAAAQARVDTSKLETRIAGQWLNRIGLLAVAIGVSYFLKLAIDNDWIGPVGQVALGLLGGAALLAATPWFLKRGYKYFADGIAGLGGTILYLSLWAGGSYYHLFSLTVAFALMIGVTAGMLAVALITDSQRIALLGLLGGFITPALVGTGRDAQAALFSYLLILIGALLPIAWRRDWRWLDLPALVLAQIYFWSWYIQFYSPGRMASTTAFAAAFFLAFLALPALRAQRDGTATWAHTILVPLNAGLWLIAFAAIFWDENRWTLTLVTIAMAALHLAVAQVVPLREGRADARLLMGGVALTLATMVVPIRLRGPWITLAWAVEGAVLMWSGFRARLARMRVLAFALLAIAAIRVLLLASTYLVSDAPPVFNARFLVEAVTVAAFAAVVWMARPYRDTLNWVERWLFDGMSVLVNLLAIAALTEEIRYVFRAGTTGGVHNPLAEGLSISLLWTVYAAALMMGGLRQEISGLRWQALALFGVTILKVFFNDMSYLSGIYRVASSVALGIVLLTVSFFYQRGAKAPRPEGA